MPKKLIFHNFFLVLLFVFLSSVLINFAQDTIRIGTIEKRFVGKFEEQLIPDTRELYFQKLLPLPKENNIKFNFKIFKEEKISSSFVLDPRNSVRKILILIIEKPNEAPLACSDHNSDQNIETKECRIMTQLKENPNAFEVTLDNPLSQTDFKTFPIFLRLRRDLTSKDLKENESLVQFSTWAIAAGYVNINDKQVYVGYEYNFSQEPINPKRGMLFVDVNGNGKFENSPFSIESSYAYDETVFRVNDTYFSTQKIDIALNEIIIRPRDKSDYIRQEFDLGKEIENFNFIDFDNKQRSLNDFRGKYLLVDFWGVWCIDCRKETPFHIEAYKLFRSRGLEILGMNTDEDLAKVKPYLVENKINWTQAKFDSIKELVEKKYGIQQYPSTLLLGPDGKILVLDQEKLKGYELSKTLNKILPK